MSEPTQEQVRALLWTTATDLTAPRHVRLHALLALREPPPPQFVKQHEPPSKVDTALGRCDDLTERVKELVGRVEVLESGRIGDAREYRERLERLESEQRKTNETLDAHYASIQAVRQPKDAMTRAAEEWDGRVRCGPGEESAISRAETGRTA